MRDRDWQRDDQARRLLEAVVAELRGCLDGLLAEFDPLKLLPQLGFEASYGLPAADESDIHRPSARPDRFGLGALMVGMAARVAMERAALCELRGTTTPTMADIGEIVWVAATYVALDSFRDLTTLTGAPQMPSMGAVAVRIADDVITVDFQRQDFDLLGYMRLRSERVLDYDAADEATWLALGHGDTPAEFDKLSKAMLTDLGFPLDDLISVLVYGIRANLNNGQCVIVDAHSYRDQAIGSLSSHAAKAFDYLTFSRAHLSREDLRPSGTRHQRRRLITHPFIQHEDKVYLFRDIQFEAMLRWRGYLLNADWPIPTNALEKIAPNVAAAMASRSADRGKGAFESLVKLTLDEIGLPWGATSSAAATIAGTTIAGAVDTMVADVANRTIWVLECKDHKSDQNLRSLQGELGRMLGRPAGQVERTTADVERDPAGVARLLVRQWAQHRGLERAAVHALLQDVAAVTAWQVKPVLVVRDRSAAEFLINRRWEVVPVSGIRPLLLGRRTA